MGGFNELLNSIIEYLLSAPGNKATIGQVARAVDRSPPYLRRILSDVDGEEVTPGKVLRILREGGKTVLALVSGEAVT